MARRGRPRMFDRTEALRRAMDLFWVQGYESTSISELAAAMGINSPSLYASFGSKEALFREAVAFYDATEGEATAAALREPTARESMEALLRNNLVAYTDPGKPRGCMIVMAAANIGKTQNEEVRRYVAQYRGSTISLLQERLRRGVEDGDVPPDADIAAISAFFTTVLHGLSIQANDGASREELHRVADAAIAAWDGMSTAGLRPHPRQSPADDARRRRLSHVDPVSIRSDAVRVEGEGRARRRRRAEVSMRQPRRGVVMSEPNILLTGLVIGESPRWHEGRLWLSNWGTQEVIAIDAEGNSEVMAKVPTTIPFSIDWLPDGHLLVTCGPEERLLRQESDGSLVDHADLSGLAFEGLNEIVVDGRGNIYVNGGCTFEPGEGERPGGIALVTPDGSVRQVADEIAFPNGMVVTPDNSTLIISESFAGQLTAFDIAADGCLSNRRVWADGVGPDGICIDTEGAIWTGVGQMGENLVGRVREGGDVLERVQLDLPCFACMLGGPDGRTLYMVANDWRVADHFTDNLRRLTTGSRTGQVLTAAAPAPGAGWP